MADKLPTVVVGRRWDGHCMDPIDGRMVESTRQWPARGTPRTDMINQPDIGPFGRLLGFEVVEWQDGFCRMAMALRPEHLNRSGVLHGGIVSTLLDTACGYAATWCRRPGHVRWVVSVTLTTHFVGQARDGILTTTARKRGGGRKIVMASAEVLDEQGRLIGFGDGVVRYRSGSEDPDGIPYRPPD